MGSSLKVKLTVDIGGQPFPFAQPFTLPFLELEQDPAVYAVTIDSGDFAVLWDGTPPISTYDFLVLMANRDCQIEFTVNGGEADEYHFTLPLLGGGFPIVVPGGQAYAGQTGTEDAFTNGTLRPVTKIRALNSDADFPAVVNVLIAQRAS